MDSGPLHLSPSEVGAKPHAQESGLTEPPFRSLVDHIGIATAALLPIFVLPGVFIPRHFSAHLAVGLIAGSAGLPALAGLARRGDRAAVAAIAFVVWLVVSTIPRDLRALIFLGPTDGQLGVLAIALVLGIWAIGRAMSPTAKALVPRVMVISMSISAVVAIAQWVFDARDGLFALTANRASGLSDHPVYFGQMVAAGAALTVMQNRARYQEFVLIALFASAANLSGSRAALVALTFGVLALSAATRSWKRAVWAAGAASASIIVTEAAVRSAQRGSTAITRLRKSSATRSGDGVVGTGLSDRFDVWRASLNALQERPLAGWGLGRFNAAIQGHTPDSLAVGGAFWRDAHNIFLWLGTETGLVGLSIAAVFATFALQHVPTGSLLAACAFALPLLLEPVRIAPLAAILLLVGSAAPTVEWPASRMRHRSSIVLLIASALAAAGLVTLDAAADRDWAGGRSRAIETLAAVLWFDPPLAHRASHAVITETPPAADRHDRSLQWLRHAVERDPAHLNRRANLAAALAAAGEPNEAVLVLRESISMQPNHQWSWRVMYSIADALGDEELRAEARDHLCAPRGNARCT